MRPKLKLNHIKSLHDARYCSAVGVALLGFQIGGDEESSMKPAAIAEIMEWLSGPEAVGEFEYQTPDEIRELAGQAKVTWISIPVDYPAPTAGDLNGQLIFRASSLDAAVFERIVSLSAQFPKAIFEFPVDPNQGALWDKLLASGLVERAILAYEAPDPIYTLLRKDGLKPYAFSLGDFVEEPDGLLDYETCDDFIDQFMSLLPA